MVIRRLLLISVAGLLTLPSTAGSRPLGNGTTITLTRERPGAIVCAGFCPSLNLTVWDDGEAVVNRWKHIHLTNEQVNHFRTILLPLRSGDANVDPSTIFPKDCWVKVQWPVNKHGRRPVACGGELFPTILQALRSINLDANGRFAI
jgi:hypothetical protein